MGGETNVTSVRNRSVDRTSVPALASSYRALLEMTQQLHKCRTVPELEIAVTAAHVGRDRG